MHRRTFVELAAALVVGALIPQGSDELATPPTVGPAPDVDPMFPVRVGNYARVNPHDGTFEVLTEAKLRGTFADILEQHHVEMDYRRAVSQKLVRRITHVDRARGIITISS